MGISSVYIIRMFRDIVFVCMLFYFIKFECEYNQLFEISIHSPADFDGLHINQEFFLFFLILKENLKLISIMITLSFNDFCYPRNACKN